MTDIIYEKLQSIVSSDRIMRDEPMCNHTTFRTGGPCDIFVSVADEKEAEEIIRLLSAHNFPYCVIGNGSNLLVPDDGYRGVIIEIGKK
mgnify:CR=1 FL=1